MSKPRVWSYDRNQWTGRWPSIGGDEWGRWTLVFPLWRVFVVALWNSCDWRGHLPGKYCQECFDEEDSADV